MEKKELYLSTTDKKIAGVCGGLAEYFNISSSILRVCWVLFVLAGGCGILAYLLCWIFFKKKTDI